ncbi:quinone oxidoreductase family protein [Streptomyces chrestomyceticus]|uniref:Zinc-binding dehydrogenase n=1 Tax=Streptomyces chrestomyceticus TaxID=68185 RepID=A0ABU7WLN3_9ACTN
MRAVVINRFGGPEVLEMAEVPAPRPAPGQQRIDVALAGVNYADTAVRRDAYPVPIQLPFTPGNEVMGALPDGRRVVALSRGGGYASQTVVNSQTIFDVPDSVSDADAVALTLQGATAFHLLYDNLQIQPGERVLIPAAAGGVGTLSVQLAANRGARVIAMASTPEKRALAMALGAHAVVDSSSVEALSERVEEAAGGPIHAALEMTGGPVFQATLDALAVHGRMVVYGAAAGEYGTVPVSHLLATSQSISGFWLPTLYSNPSYMRAILGSLFLACEAGDIKPVHHSTAYRLEDARQAHEDLAARRTIGKVALIAGP